MSAVTFFWDPIEDNVIQAKALTGELTNFDTEPIGFGDVNSVTENGSVQYLHSDSLGSILATTDDNQGEIGRWSYSGFGVSTESNGARPAGLGFVGKKQYTVTPTNQLTVRRRVYSTASARWLSIDPVKNDPLWNLYRYCANMSTKAIDASGLAYTTKPPAVNPCCCCVDSLTYKARKMTGITDDGRKVFGHLITTSIQLSYVKAGVGDCKLEWWEWTDMPYAVDDGQKEKTWQDLKDFPTIRPYFKSWNERDTRKPCPGKPPVIVDEDTPSCYFTTAYNKRTLYIAIVVRSAIDCKCAARKKTLFFKQVLEVAARTTMEWWLEPITHFTSPPRAPPID